MKNRKAHIFQRKGSKIWQITWSVPKNLLYPEKRRRFTRTTYLLDREKAQKIADAFNLVISVLEAKHPHPWGSDEYLSRYTMMDLLETLVSSFPPQ